MSRYEKMFTRLEAAQEIAFIPFVTVGDPDLTSSEAFLDVLVDAGADALELGIAFSDPIADGPVIQEAAVRALAAGTTPGGALGAIARLRGRHPEVPIGLLVYANLVYTRGLDAFYGAAADAGVDSVLVADVPVQESAPFCRAAERHGVEPVLIATPNASDTDLGRIARATRGYTYTVTRRGVTGAQDELEGGQRAMVERLQALGAPPPVLGFGLSKPEHVAQARLAGARGAISGSAVVRRIAENLGDEEGTRRALRRFVGEMKAATR